MLRILDTLFRCVGILPVRTGEFPGYVRRFDKLLRGADKPLPEVAALAGAMGYQPDHLNRLFKAATGRTLREYRDAVAMERAQRALQAYPKIKQACDALGSTTRITLPAGSAAGGDESPRLPRAALPR